MPVTKDEFNEDGKFMRKIRSFVRREGRLTKGQEKALEELWPVMGIDFAPQPLDMVALFGREAPVVLEIGFGMGEATAPIAAQLPHINFLCCEVHEPGVGALLKHIGDMGLSNLRILRHDAVEVLEHMIPPASLAGVHIFFPDPWHKKRHNKRRLVQPAFAALLVSRLRVGGRLHAATDWQDYAEQMWDVLDATPGLVNRAGPRGPVPRPDWRPQTHFETRGQKLGHGVWDLVYDKRGEAGMGKGES